MEKTINSPFEKCLDCFNYKKLQGSYRCYFGLTPVMVRGQDEKDKERIDCICYGYDDHGGKDAPARRELMKRARKSVRASHRRKN